MISDENSSDDSLYVRLRLFSLSYVFPTTTSRTLRFQTSSARGGLVVSLRFLGEGPYGLLHNGITVSREDEQAICRAFFAWDIFVNVIFCHCNLLSYVGFHSRYVSNRGDIVLR